MKKRNSNPLKHTRIRFWRNCSLWAECSWKSKRLSQSFLLIMGWRSYLYNVWIVVVEGLRKFTRFCNIVGIVWNTLVSEVLQTHKAEKRIPHLLALEIFGIFFFSSNVNIMRRRRSEWAVTAIYKNKRTKYFPFPKDFCFAFLGSASQ